jgi:uncharacterized membrane protein YjjB (DUF3815 family)
MENVMEMILQSAGGLVAVAGFCVVLNVPRRFIIWAGLDGALGWFLYLVVNYFSESVLLSTFFGAVLISIGAHICARIFKTPVTMFIIPANMTLVPGAGMYRIVYYTLRSQKEMSTYYFQETLQTAGMIAVAIFVVNIILNNFISGVRIAKRSKHSE